MSKGAQCFVNVLSDHHYCQLECIGTTWMCIYDSVCVVGQFVGQRTLFAVCCYYLSKV